MALVGCLAAADFTADFDNRIQTEHYIFYFDGSADGNIREIGRFSEDFDGTPRGGII